jgi:predicted outer membrane repeat protein
MRPGREHETGCCRGSILFLLLILPGLSTAATIRVPNDYSLIQQAIDAASEHDSVLVAPGVYSGSGNKNLTFGGKDLVICSEGGAKDTVIDCEGEGRAFYLQELLTPAAVIKGFTITNGNGNTKPIGGGAIFIAGGSPTVVDCHFVGNSALGAIQAGGGGAICLYNSESTISGCTFIDNESRISSNDPIGRVPNGGGIALNASHIRVRDCLFQGNQAAGQGGGGGIAVTLVVTGKAAAVIEDCEFHGNQARIGGGAYLSSSEVSRCSFTNNEALSGGGLFGVGVTLEDCAIIGNMASDSAGGASLASQASVSRVLFAENSAPRGGGIISNGPQATLTDCVIVRNRASFGGGFYGYTQVTVFVNCTIVGNEAQVGSGLLLYAIEPATWRLEKCIIADNGPGAAVVCEGQASAVFSCSNIHGNAGGDWVDCVAGQDGAEGNFSADPLFCQGGTDWHLCGDSPCAPKYSGGCGLIGALPVGCSACGVAITPSTWGQIKHHLARQVKRTGSSK